MANEIKQTLPQKVCAEFWCMRARVLRFLFSIPIPGKKTGNGVGKKKEFRHVVAYSTFTRICNVAHVHQLQLTFYLSELPITRTSWFFFNQQQLTLRSLHWLLHTVHILDVYMQVRLKRWMPSMGFRSGETRTSILRVSLEHFNEYSAGVDAYGMSTVEIFRDFPSLTSMSNNM